MKSPAYKHLHGSDSERAAYVCRVLLRHLTATTTSGRPATAAQLCRLLGITQTELREAVHLLRCRGMAIASSSAGYWFTSCAADIDMTIAHGLSRIRSIQEWVDAMKVTRSVMSAPGAQQLSLALGFDAL